MFKEYFDYLKENPQKYWFKAKLYGWGWVPVRWQGWLVVLAFMVFLFLNSPNVDSGQEASITDLSSFFVKITLAVVLLIIICYKTGEKPGWRWGLPKNK